MSQQGGMFAPQENEPQRQENRDPREQPSEQQRSYTEQGPYQTGYSGAGPDWMSGEKVRPIAPQAPIPVWQWIVGALLLLIFASVIGSILSAIFGSLLGLIGIVIGVLAISQLSVRKVQMPVRTFNVSDQPKLVIQNSAGTLHIRRGNTNTVEVKATKYINGWFGSSDEGSIDYNQNGDILRVATRSFYKWSPLGGLRNVNLDISVPAFTDVRFDGSAGTVDIEDIRGQINVNTNAGTIDVRRATLDHQSVLTTNAGTINIRDAYMKGQVGVHTNAGTVDFSGELDQQGHYRFDTNAGTVTISLPANASFELQAKTDLGTINNQFGSNSVGSAPRPRLELNTNLGTVTVRRR